MAVKRDGQVGVLEVAHLGLDIPWYCQVDHQDRPVLALLQCMLHRTFAKNGQLAASGRNNNVRVDQLLGNIGQQYRLGAKTLRQFAGTTQGAVGHHHLGNTRFSQVAGHQVDRLAGADQQGTGTAQVREDVASQVHGRIGHRHRVFADGGIGAHPLGNGEYPREQSHQLRTHRARLFGNGEG